MQTIHRIYFENAKQMGALPPESVDLVVTSPPYPMIEMWDDVFAAQNSQIRRALRDCKGMQAFEAMHKELDAVWDEVYRVLRFGGTACINIGDATRTIGGNFILYPNHSRILTHLHQIGFSALPQILWRKQTNAPNKFMGSGMMPPGAYVTLEHEHILILRKGPKREFETPDEKQNRRESAFFWEERNTWYSDIWMDLKGTTQKLNADTVRLRSAAFPFDLPYRLINMFSVKGDTVLDPFLGTGTTLLAAMAAGRNSLGFEREPGFRESIHAKMDDIVPFANARIRSRLMDHVAFIKARCHEKGGFKYANEHYGFPVVTNQEKALLLNRLVSLEESEKHAFRVIYSDEPQEEFRMDGDSFLLPRADGSRTDGSHPPRKTRKAVQLELLK